MAEFQQLPNKQSVSMMIAEPDVSIKEKINIHYTNKRQMLFFNLIAFGFLLNFGSTGLRLLSIYPQTLLFPAQPQEPNWKEQNTLIFVVLSSLGLIFGIFSGYVNDFVMRKYAFLIYVFPYYINIVLQFVYAVWMIANRHDGQSAADGSQTNHLEQNRQLQLIIELVYHNIADGYKVVTYLILLEYFEHKDFYWHCAISVVSTQDLPYTLHCGIYQLVVYFNANDFFNQDVCNKDSFPQYNFVKLSMARSVQIGLLSVYVFTILLSVFFFKRILRILEEKHKIEQRDRKLLDYHYSGSSKNNLFQNYGYLFSKSNFLAYLAIFIIFTQTSYFPWVSKYQTLFYQQYSQNYSISNVFSPVNQILNSIFSTFFTLIIAYTIRDHKSSSTTRVNSNQNVSYHEIVGNIPEIETTNMQNQENNKYSPTNPQQLIVKRRQLDQKLRLSCLIISIFNFIMLIENTCNSCDSIPKDQTKKSVGYLIISNTFLVLMLACTCLIGTAYNFLLMSSVLKIVQLFHSRNKALGSALSVMISAVYCFEFLNYIIVSDGTVIYSIYFALNSLALFAMITIHSRDSRPIAPVINQQIMIDINGNNQ